MEYIQPQLCRHEGRREGARSSAQCGLEASHAAHGAANASPLRAVRFSGTANSGTSLKGGLHCGVAGHVAASIWFQTPAHRPGVGGFPYSPSIRRRTRGAASPFCGVKSKWSLERSVFLSTPLSHAPCRHNTSRVPCLCCNTSRVPCLCCNTSKVRRQRRRGRLWS